MVDERVKILFKPREQDTILLINCSDERYAGKVGLARGILQEHEFGKKLEEEVLEDGLHFQHSGGEVFAGAFEKGEVVAEGAKEKLTCVVDNFLIVEVQYLTKHIQAV
jgi:hypothetical protein